MRVNLISHTRDPERTVASAMRLCYSASDIDNIIQNLDQNEASRLIRKVLTLGHLSVLEHASFTFAIEGISRACSHQLVRHRMASFSQQSQRYVSMLNFNHTIPTAISNNPDILNDYNQTIDNIRKQYEKLLLCGISAEDARYILPNSTETKLIMTANARSLLNFFELRLCTRAQWEIRKLAELMLIEVKAIAPVLFESAGPSCESKGFCNEGEMTCGRMSAISGNSQNGEGRT
ncbi:MAG: FAD-dependent thymidylate synthase [Armatimonadota bacterium]